MAILAADRVSTTGRRATNVSLPTDQLTAAKRLGINVSRACELGLREAVRAAREAEWLEENREAIEERVRYVEAHGLPLDRDRMFPI